MEPTLELLATIPHIIRAQDQPSFLLPRWIPSSSSKPLLLQPNLVQIYMPGQSFCPIVNVQSSPLHCIINMHISVPEWYTVASMLSMVPPPSSLPSTWPSAAGVLDNLPHGKSYSSSSLWTTTGWVNFTVAKPLLCLMTSYCCPHIHWVHPWFCIWMHFQGPVPTNTFHHMAVCMPWYYQPTIPSQVAMDPTLELLATIPHFIWAQDQPSFLLSRWIPSRSSKPLLLTPNLG